MVDIAFSLKALGNNPVREIVGNESIFEKQVRAGFFEKIDGELKIIFWRTPEGLVFNAQ